MPFVPHTESDVAAMLKAIGANSIDDLFDEIPSELIIKSLAKVPETGLYTSDAAFTDSTTATAPPVVTVSPTSGSST